MSSTTEQARAARRVRHAAIRAEVAQEEAETAEEEAAEKAATLDVPSHLRIDAALDAQLRAREQPTSTSPPPRWSGDCSATPCTSWTLRACQRPRWKALPAASPGKN